MSHIEVAATIHSTPGTPSIQARRANFEDISLPPPDSRMIQDLERDLGVPPGGIATDNTDTLEPSVVSPSSMLGARGKTTNSMSFSESSVTSDPRDNGKYNRFNEKKKNLAKRRYVTSTLFNFLQFCLPYFAVTRV